MVQSRSKLILFAGYLWVTTLAGLALHPYKSVRGIVIDRERRVLMPVLITPTLSIFAMLVLGRVGSLIFDLGGLRRETMAFVLGVVSITLLMWQILMMFLLVRFSRVKRDW